VDEDVPQCAQMGGLADRIPGFLIRGSFVQDGQCLRAVMAAAGVLRDRYI